MSNKQQLVLSIIDFLKASIADGTVSDADAESLDVGIQCIGEAFSVDPTDKAQAERLSIKPATLQTIFDVYLKTKAAHATPAAAAAPKAAPPATKDLSAEDKSSAETFKAAGNAQMAQKDYPKAIESYGKAIALNDTNPVYFSNRAAAYSSSGDHLSAVADAEQAIAVDPKFVKAYHRLGHAQYSLSDFKAAADAFRKGLALDPANANLKSGLTNSEARIPADDDDDDGPPPLERPVARGAGGAGGAPAGMPDFSALAGLMGGGGGGMPDLASMMSNPMVQSMMQQMQANGGMESLMNNPAVANMMNRVQSGGGMPSMEEIMGDPALRNIAQQFGAGGAAP